MTDLNAPARELLCSARQSGTTIDLERRSRVRRAILAGAGISSAATAASFSIGKLVLVGVVSGALGSGATLAIIRWQAQGSEPASRARAVPAQSVPVPIVVAPPPPPVVEAPSPPPTPEPARTIVRLQPALPPPEQIEASTVEPAPSALPLPDDSTITAELEVLDRALSAVNTHSWADAQAALEEHRVRFQHPVLPSEAGALQVAVWCAAGRTEEAKNLARELEQRDALNPAVQRLASSCAKR